MAFTFDMESIKYIQERRKNDGITKIRYNDFLIELFDADDHDITSIRISKIVNALNGDDVYSQIIFIDDYGDERNIYSAEPVILLNKERT